MRIGKVHLIVAILTAPTLSQATAQESVKIIVNPDVEVSQPKASSPVPTELALKVSAN